MPDQRFSVEIYYSRSLRALGGQRWRWRAVSGPFKEKLAYGEAYLRKQDMLATVWLLFGYNVIIREVTA
jgi:hypothetical protein